MSLPLIIVESPTKARSISKYLSKQFKVLASKGHVRDLPKSKMGVDIENGFKPDYVVVKSKKKVISQIKKSAKNASFIYLAPDPDREGEAIAWHLYELIKSQNQNIKRVLFNEITKKGVKRGLDSPRELNRNLFESQQARRIVDRLVGYELSPLLWKKVRRGLSAGRVQSVALRLVVEREEEIEKFEPVEYWLFSVDLSKKTSAEKFSANLWRVKGKKAKLPDAQTVEELKKQLSGEFKVVKITKKESKRNAPPPYITSTLQQNAASRYYFPAKKTMRLAQKLYEGIDLGKGNMVDGLITYMRTDSTRVSKDAVAAVRSYISNKVSSKYVPAKPNYFRKKKGAQDAHEAIRPTDVSRTPGEISQILSKSRLSQREVSNLVKLYSLIWHRFVASQMKPAIYDSTTVEIERGNLLFRTKGQVLKFKGYTAIYDYEKKKSKDKFLPELEEGEVVNFEEVNTEQKFTKPPARYNEASLIKELEQKGIGRPSTYANIISTITGREYVEKIERNFAPTELGKVVTRLLIDSFPNIMDVEFTAEMEKQLDDVEMDKVHWKDILNSFYHKFHENIEKAEQSMPNLKTKIEETDIECDKCKAKMVIRWGRNGKFLACSNYPECKNTKEFKKDKDGNIKIILPEKREEKCPKCEAPMVLKKGKYGSFLGCSKYPDCKGTRPLLLPYDCPEKGCNGKLIERRTRRGKKFYGCSNYSKDGGCQFSTWKTPVDEECPACHSKYLLKRVYKRKANRLDCPVCDYSTKEG
ncbi:MAG: type I DNA topoisomerase [Myxococcota bacterium]